MAIHHVQLSDESTNRLRRLAAELEMSQAAVVARALKALEREEKRLAEMTDKKTEG